jgi:hypothetical protein
MGAIFMKIIYAKLVHDEKKYHHANSDADRKAHNIYE